MRAELDEKLCREFPSLFADRNADVRTTAMCWGFECGDGWYDLIRTACQYMESVLRCARDTAIYQHKVKHNIAFELELPPGVLKQIGVDEMTVVATQVKEKFGTLRFYWQSNGLSEREHYEIVGCVGAVECISGRTCETCGAPGVLRGPGWLSTACDKCADGKSTMAEYNAWVDEQETKGVEVDTADFHRRNDEIKTKGKAGPC